MRESTDLKPTVHVGKDGVTGTLVQEIKLQLKKRRVIKVRLLPSAGEDKGALAKVLADQANATLVDLRGSIITLCEKRYYRTVVPVPKEND